MLSLPNDGRYPALDLAQAVGSVQWASSKIINTGCWLANLQRTLEALTTQVASCVEVEVCASTASSLSSFASGLSFRLRALPGR
jgi:hypothetical protein